jgi:16S rRNA (cytosine1402-N4)-methyltransferase
MEQEVGHLPVMLEEVIVALSPHPGSFQIDATVGGGGHAIRILEASNPGGRLLGLDADESAIERTARRLKGFGESVTLRHTNFEDMAQVAADAGFGKVDGILMDLGLSSPQLDGDKRGFSFRAEGTLDMRFDPTTGVPASEVVNTADVDELTPIIRTYGEERQARRIARAIVEQRAHAPIETPARLAEVVSSVVHRDPRRDPRRRIHPATRTFQALRIHVNRELDVLAVALERCLDLLRPDGRLCVISYHSLEDRIVKRFIARERRGCICDPGFPVCVCGREPRLARVGSQPQVPTAEEVAINPRARSAKLRATRRLAA